MLKNKNELNGQRFRRHLEYSRYTAFLNDLDIPVSKKNNAKFGKEDVLSIMFKTAMSKSSITGHSTSMKMRKKRAPSPEYFRLLFKKAAADFDNFKFKRSVKSNIAGCFRFTLDGFLDDFFLKLPNTSKIKRLRHIY